MSPNEKTICYNRITVILAATEEHRRELYVDNLARSPKAFEMQNTLGGRGQYELETI